VVGNELRPQVFQEMSWIARPAVYVPIAQRPPNYFSIAIRAAGAQTGITHMLEETLASMDSQVAMGDVETMHSRVALHLKYPEFRAAVLSAFAFSAILLAAVGLYGVLAQFVGQRTREIGIRMAVGADTCNIVMLVAWKGGMPFLAGLAIGLAASLGLSGFLSGLLYGVTPTDPVAFSAVFATMLGSAVLAVVVPAKRALRVDPMVAMKSE
jgi:putative ABC transport system permease protein